MNMPTRRSQKMLREVADGCRVSRNAMACYLEAWHRENPDAKKVAPKEIAKQMYYYGRAASPNINSTLISACRKQVIKDFKAHVAYNHPARKRYRYKWQAIRGFELSRQCFTKDDVPVLTQDARIVLNGMGTGKCSGELLDRGKSSCILWAPLFSRVAGFEQKGIIARLGLRTLDAGHGGDKEEGRRKVVERICRGEWEMCQSRLVFRDDKWFLRLSYKRPAINHWLNVDNVATVVPGIGKDSKWPFWIIFPDGSTLGLGFGKPYKAEWERLSIRRKSIRRRHRDGLGKGHGKGGFYKHIKPYERAGRDMQDRFVKTAMAFLVKQLIANDCGSLMYREPTMPAREHTWFAKNSLPMNWTEFESFMRWKAELNTIAYEKERIGAKNAAKMVK